MHIPVPQTVLCTISPESHNCISLTGKWKVGHNGYDFPEVCCICMTKLTVFRALFELAPKNLEKNFCLSIIAHFATNKLLYTLHSKTFELTDLLCTTHFGG